MPAFKSAYLIHGDDHGRVVERRSRFRALAESDGGSLEIGSTPEASAALLAALTLSIGRRFIIADGVEGWKDADVKEHLVDAIAAMPPDTTIAFFAREDGRIKAPPALHSAVKAAGGDVSAELGQGARLQLDLLGREDALYRGQQRIPVQQLQVPG